ncbi:putative neprosin [Helianthus annuus]|nr:putative neprosin [Helianthus annuus]KAJ0696861.1 putative neprosin [Helianthus annuus]KAJ0743767.1 putative neprosin [Helianthus annuus]
MFQMKSSHLHPTEDTANSKTLLASQVWLEYGRCPNGTIPIRRASNKPKRNVHPRKFIVTKDHSVRTDPPINDLMALTTGYSYSGAKANIKVFNPYVESVGDYSSSQVMLRTGPLQSFETAEAGWAVNPIVYNDDKTRLFAYWTVGSNVL